MQGAWKTAPNAKLSARQMNMPIATPKKCATWNFRHLGAALFTGFVLQSLLLPCLCAVGTAKITFAYSFDGLVLLRMLLACFRRETCKGWLVYALLCHSSPAWIEGVTYLVLGEA